MTVENYLENRKIWAELEHYKKTGAILGEHEIFERRRKEKELAQLSGRQVKIKIGNLKRQIKYREEIIADAGTDEKIDVKQRTDELRVLKQELRFLNNRLNDYGKGKKHI
jgi:hypothetical protein